jgi:hypothetical protein
MKNLIYILWFLLTISSCENKAIVEKEGKPISFNDPTLIVTETDSSKLINTVNDITPKNKMTGVKQITKLVAQVDSVAVVNEVAAQSGKSIAMSTIIAGDGFTINTDLPLEQLNNKYKLTTGRYIDNFKIAVTNLTEVIITQTMFSKLSYTFNNKDYPLTDLPEYKNPTITLQSSNNVFNGLKYSDAIYKNTDASTLILATDRALRKDNLDRKSLKASATSLKQIKNYTDASCKVNLSGILLKITGKLNGNTVTKNITITF